MVTLRAGLCLAMAACVWLAPQVGWATDFAIDSRLFINGAAEPQSANTTIFVQGIAYDYSSLFGEVSILDPGGRRFILLNPRTQQRVDVPLATVQEFTRGLPAACAQSPQELVRFLGNPKFEEQLDRESGKLTLNSKLMNYEVATVEAPAAEAAAAYRQFADWYTQLNTMTNPGGLPPFGRMRLNHVLATANRLPQEVHLTVRSDRSADELRLRSVHVIRWELSPNDRKRTQEADEMFQRFEAVRPEVYFGQGQAAPAAPAPQQAVPQGNVPRPGSPPQPGGAVAPPAADRRQAPLPR